jgi:hypothetical protein
LVRSALSALRADGPACSLTVAAQDWQLLAWFLAACGGTLRAAGLGHGSKSI